MLMDDAVERGASSDDLAATRPCKRFSQGVTRLTNVNSASAILPGVGSLHFSNSLTTQT